MEVYRSCWIRGLVEGSKEPLGLVSGTDGEVIPTVNKACSETGIFNCPGGLRAWVCNGSFTCEWGAGSESRPLRGRATLVPAIISSCFAIVFSLTYILNRPQHKFYQKQDFLLLLSHGFGHWRTQNV